MQGILFDLDGTLLDIDMGAFLRRYFDALAETVAQLVPAGQVENAMQALNDATEAMIRPHPGVTNKDVFHREYLRLTGVDIDANADVFSRFYEERFPSLGGGTGPVAGAEEALAAAEEIGLRIAIATNPIFPLRAVEHRLSWAGIDPSRAHAITAYECMHACKPLRAYFDETAQMIGVEPRDCLMIGDDPILDMSAVDSGMATFSVGEAPSPHATYRGTLEDLPDLLERIFRV